MTHYFFFKSQDLRKYMIRCFTQWEVPQSDAQIAAEILLSADKRGVDSHGIIRLFSYYGSRLQKRLIDPKSPVSVLRETLTTLALDGGNGLGHPVSYKAMQMVIEKAKENSVGFATVRNSNHFGIAGYYAMMALPHNMIGICYTNSTPLVAPTYGKKAMLGTNPIAVAVPARSQLPFVLDMATSIVPIGRISVFQKKRKAIPSGWGMDSEGNPTEDPEKVLQGGALMPLGGPEHLRGYKGYGLALMVDIFAGVLAGASFGENILGGESESPANVGHFFGAFRIDAFRDIFEFKKDMDEIITQLKDSPKAAGQERIYIHGEKEFERAAQAEIEGVPLSDATVSVIREGGEKFSIPFSLVPIKQADLPD